MLVEQADRSRIALGESERARFWFAVKIATACALGCLTGFVPMAWALHTTNLEAARLAWAIGPVLGQMIVLIALLFGWIRWQREEW